MIEIRGQVQPEFDRLKKAAKKGSARSLEHGGAIIRIIARRSIRVRRKGGRKGSAAAAPSPPGKPPRTSTKRLRNAILFAMVRDDLVRIGPSARIIADAGSAHEHGGHFRDENYPRRPFMGPALEQAAPRLSSLWAGAVR